ncbi:MAG: alpha/beta fold hydrolase [Usitatibacter sp.]
MIDYSDNGKGLPVVLIHAFPQDRTLWQPQIDAFSSRYRIVAPTLRGFAGSDPVDGKAVSMDSYADDVAALMGELGIAKAVIGGISLGGYVTLSLALRYPDRVLGIVLANTRATADNPDWAKFREDLVSDVETRGPVAVVENYGDKPFRPDCPKDIKAEIRAMIMKQPSTGLASGTRGMASRPDRTPRLGEIRVPTLVISGTKDAYIPSSDGEAMHQAIAGSTFVDIEGAGHLSNYDSAPQFNLALEEFLRKLEP